jgi:heat shock transcription factor, other eukaryote
LQGFRKVDPDRWEFANEGFLRGQRHLLKTIKRRKPLATVTSSRQQPTTPASCLEVGEFGFEEEIDRLKRDKNILITEVVKLRQEQQTIREHLHAMEERLGTAEQKQVQMMGFLVRAMRNPEFFQQLVQQQDKRKELEDAISKKRRRPIDSAPFYSPEETSQSEQLDSQFLFDSSVFDGLTEPGMPELENLAASLIYFPIICTTLPKPLNVDFWEELLIEDYGEKAGQPELEERTEVVDEITEQLGYLSSTSPK